MGIALGQYMSRTQLKPYYSVKKFFLSNHRLKFILPRNVVVINSKEREMLFQRKTLLSR